MNPTNARLTSWALIVGSVVATAGYASAFVVNGNGDERFAGSSWVALYTIALLGNVIVLLGLPAIVHAQRGRAPVLTRIGYAGVLVPLVILNIGEGTVEGFVKPYLATHGGIPADDLPGLTAYEIPALLVHARRAWSAWASRSCGPASCPGGSECCSSWCRSSARPACRARSRSCPTTCCSWACSPSACSSCAGHAYRSRWRPWPDDAQSLPTRSTWADLTFVRARGSVIVKVAPSPGAERTSTRPS